MNSPGVSQHHPCQELGRVQHSNGCHQGPAVCRPAEIKEPFAVLELPRQRPFFRWAVGGGGLAVKRCRPRGRLCATDIYLSRFAKLRIRHDVTGHYPCRCATLPRRPRSRTPSRTLLHHPPSSPFSSFFLFPSALLVPACVDLTAGGTSSRPFLGRVRRPSQLDSLFAGLLAFVK